MPTLFLDTHIWNYLVENNNYSDEELEHARARLIQGAQDCEWQVVCSLPVLQEIVRVFRDNPQKYDRIKELAFAVVGHRWLQDLNTRYVAELYSGGLLSSTARYLPREERKSIRRLADKIKDVIEVGDIAYKEGSDYKTIMDEAKTKVYSDLGSTDGKAPEKIAQAYEHWFANDRDLEGWLLKVLQGGVTRNRYPKSLIENYAPSFDSSPSCWQYIDFRHAKILLNLGYGRAIKESDGVDAEIYGCSPYYDTLVTSDKGFREAIKRVSGGRFEVWDFAGFMDLLRTVE